MTFTLSLFVYTIVLRYVSLASVGPCTCRWIKTFYFVLILEFKTYLFLLKFNQIVFSRSKYNVSFSFYLFWTYCIFFPFLCVKLVSKQCSFYHPRPYQNVIVQPILGVSACSLSCYCIVLFGHLPTISWSFLPRAHRDSCHVLL